MGGLGGFTHYILVSFDWSRIPEFKLTTQSKAEQKKNRPEYWSSQFRLTWAFGRILLGVIAGFITFLFLVGSIKDGLPGTAKVILLAFVAGLAAPGLLRQVQAIAAERAKRILRQEADGDRNTSEKL